MLEGKRGKRIGRRTQHGRPEAARWWVICRSGTGGVETMTLPCGGEEALALFGHEEEAELYLWSLAFEGLENGWYVRESRRGEIASVLYGANARRAALDPLPMMAEEGTIELVSLDRFDFVVGLMAHDGARTRPSHEQCGSTPDRQRTHG